MYITMGYTYISEMRELHTMDLWMETSFITGLKTEILLCINCGGPPPWLIWEQMSSAWVRTPSISMIDLTFMHLCYSICCIVHPCCVHPVSLVLFRYVVLSLWHPYRIYSKDLWSETLITTGNKRSWET